MRTKALLAIFGFWFSALAAVAAPKWESAHVQEVRFRVGECLTADYLISDPGEIEQLLACFRRAAEIGKNKTVRWPQSILLQGKRPERGIWLYDSDQGEFTLLDHRSHPIYRLQEADRSRVNAYFEKIGSAKQ